LKSFNSFKKFNDSQSQKYLAQSMPKGKLTANRFDSTSWIYKLLLCLSMPIKIVSGLIEDLVRNVNIDTANELLENWETSVKIPELIPRLTDVEGRRNAVKRKVSKYPVFQLANYTSFNEYSTFENYIYIMTGLQIEIERATDRPSPSAFPFTFPMVFVISEGRRNFLFYIKVGVEGSAANNQFPLPFPVSFFDPAIPTATEELLDKVLGDIFPTYCGWVYEVMVI
jgi:uncharacterized protein YmfQ (DUF2313 family)